MFLTILNKIKRKIDPTFWIKEQEKKRLIIGESSKETIYSPYCFDNSYPWLIEVGEHVVISTNVSILAHDASTAYLCGFSKIGRVTIGNNVYIGHSSTILCNVKIGNNVIVGANTLVNKDLKENGVYAGIPAKYICSIEEFKHKHINGKETKPYFDNNVLYYNTKASKIEKQNMKKELTNTYGYIKSMKKVQENYDEKK